MRMLSRFFSVVKVFAAVALLSLAAPAGAQEGGVLMPGAGPANERERAPDVSAAPQPSIRRGSPVWVGYLAIVVMTAAVMGISLLPSKRSHQD